MSFLNGIKVIELSHMVMGPSTGLILGDLGADVLKVEPIGGDKTRSLPGSGAGYFAMFNRNKKSMCLDLKSEEGREILQSLLKGADVMTENFRSGALEKLGFGYEAVKLLSPGIIYQSSKGFLNGPYENRTALDEVAQMMGGLAYMTGPSGQPLRAGTSVVDIAGGMFGVIGILAALLNKRNPNEGAHISSALFETTVFLVGQHIAQHAVTGAPAAPMPERDQAWAVYDVFDAADRKVFAGVVSDGQWQAFCKEFDLDDWALDESFALNADRVAKRDVIIPRLRELFATMQSTTIMEKLQRAGLPFAPVQRPEDLSSDLHLAENGFHDLTLPAEGEPVKLPKLPIEMNGERLELNHDIPKIGADTDQVLTSIGYSTSRIAELKAKNIVG